MMMMMMMIIIIINKVRAHLHYSICKVLGIETKDRCCADKAICEYEDVTVLWNQASTQIEKLQETGQV